MSFKKISIRGRLAYALIYLEIFFKKRKNNIPKVLRSLLDKLWSVNTSVVDLVQLEKEFNEMSPSSILSDDYKGNFDILSYEEYLEFKKVYTNLDDDSIRLIYFLLEILFSNLYSDMGDYAVNSYDFLIKFINVCKSNEVESPDVINIKSSSFKEENGWGAIQNMKFWLDK